MTSDFPKNLVARLGFFGMFLKPSSLAERTDGWPPQNEQNERFRTDFDVLFFLLDSIVATGWFSFLASGAGCTYPHMGVS